jgi:hypothetical protein
MNRIIVCLAVILLFGACAKKTIVKEGPPQKLPPLERFFSVFEKDLQNTARVIAEQELVKNLTHLQKMNYGGQRYYPLEREALTKMIRELSSYEYSECILLNKSGTIIYTMFDDKIFAKQAEGFPATIGSLFNNGKETPYIIDMIEFPPISGRYLLFFSMPVQRDGMFDGLLIAAVSADDIVKKTAFRGSAVDHNGMIRLNPDHAKIFTQDVPNLHGEEYHYRNLEWRLTGD